MVCEDDRNSVASMAQLLVRGMREGKWCFVLGVYSRHVWGVLGCYWTFRQLGKLFEIVRLKISQLHGRAGSSPAGTPVLLIVSTNLVIHVDAI